jgi:dihydroorotase
MIKKTLLIKNAAVVNRGTIVQKDIFIKNGFIEKIDNQINHHADIEINAEGKYAIPGIIDDQVHFREPGLTHKATIYSEAKAAVRGGVTTFMEMPNTKPGALTQSLLQDKYDIAAATSLGNYSFFMGTSNDNLDEVLRTDPKTVCGIKVFMGSSTGNMLVDSESILDKLFANAPMLIATHCEDEKTVLANYDWFYSKYGENIRWEQHPLIRDEEACYLSSSFAVELAKKHNTRLHILHISTANELHLFDNTIPLLQKRITSEVCTHHLYFNSNDYATFGSQIKCNPAIKSEYNQKAIFEGLLNDKLDIIATDHAPHTWAEKQQKYPAAPSGVPLIQHSLQIMLDFFHQGKISLEKIVEKMCHAPAQCFQIEKRGFLEEGQYADIALVDIHKPYGVQKENLLYHCGWSPFEGKIFRGEVTTTIVSGHLAYHDGIFDEEKKGERISFDR